MEEYCVYCCAMCDSKNSKFIKHQEARELLSKVTGTKYRF